MNIIKKSLLFFFLIITNQFNFCGHHEPAHNYNQQLERAYLYNKSSNHEDPLAAQRLTQESYITPEMQQEILTMLDQQDTTINVITGDVQGILPIDELLAVIQEKIESPITPNEKDTIKNGLRTMLEATEIALSVANVEAALKDPKFIFSQTVNSQLLVNLNRQKQDIQAMISKINNIQVGSQSSYFSWLWSSSQPQTKQNSTFNSRTIVPFEAETTMVTIPAELMANIIKNNDYKQEKDYVKAANLLFKQCFIAQQHHLKDLNRISQIRINLQSPISANNYIYTNFPDFNSICHIAKNLVHGQRRTDLRSSTTPEQRQAHLLLQHISQAVQTAIYISNKNSTINLGYILPQWAKSQLDYILGQLVQYETQVAALCKDPQYGATQDDVYQDEQRANITKILAGVAITAVVGGGLYAYAPSAASTVFGYATQKGTDLMSWWNGNTTQPTQPTQPAATNSPTGTQAPQQNTSFISRWWNGSSTTQPTTTPTQEPVQGPANQTWTEYLKEKATWENAKNAIVTTGEIGTTAAMLGGITSVAGAAIANNPQINQLITQETGINATELGQNMQYYGQQTGIAGNIAGGLTGNLGLVANSVGTASRFIPGQAGAVGSALGSSIGTAGAIYDSYNNIGSAYQQGILPAIKAVGSAGMNVGGSAYGTVNAIANAQQALANQNPNHDNLNMRILSPQEIYMIFIDIIQKTVAQAGNLHNELNKFIGYLFANRMANPPLVADILQHMPQELTQDPAVGQPVNDIIEKLHQFSAQQQAQAAN